MATNLMHDFSRSHRLSERLSRLGVGAAAAALGCALAACQTQPVAPDSGSPAARPDVNADKLLVVDCLLPGQIRKLGTSFTYLTPRRPIKTTAVDCEIRGGEYTSYDRADYRTSLNVWLPQAKEGDPAAQNYVGEIYEKGLGIQPDYQTAAYWYSKAAAQGDSRAQINLGFLYEKGLGVDRDLAKALNLYRQASGLVDDELQYASTIQVAAAAAAREQTAALRREVDQQRQEAAALRSQLQETETRLQRQQQELRAAEMELKRRQQNVQQRVATASGPVDDAELQALRSEVLEQELVVARQRANIAALETALRDQRVELETELAASRREGRFLEEDLARRNEEIESMRRKLVATQAEVNTARAELAARKADLERERSQLEQAHEELAGANRQVATRDAELQRLQRELAKRDAALEEQRDAVARLESEAATYEAQLVELKTTTSTTAGGDAEVASLRTSLAETQKALADAQDALADREGELERERQRLNQTATQLQSTGATASEREAELRRLQRELDQREAELQRQHRRIARLEEEAQAYRAQLSALETTQATVAAQRADIDGLRQKLDQTQRELAAAQDQLATRETQLQSERQQLERTAERLQATGVTAAEREAQLRHLAQALSQRETELRQQRRAVARLEGEATSYGEQLNEFEKTKATVARQDTHIAVLRRKLTETQTELTSAQKRLTSKETQLEAERQRLQATTATAAEREAQTEQLQRELSQREKELQEKEQALAKLERDAAELRTKIAAAPPAAQVAASHGPAIEILDPPVALTRGIPTVQLRAPAKERLVVGKVTSPAGLASFTVNDQTQAVDATGLFKTNIPIDLAKKETPVRMVAVDRRGRSAAVEFLIVPKLRYASTPDAIEPAPPPSLSLAQRLREVEFGTYYALIIGNNAYQRLPSLDTAVNDAETTERILREKYGFKTTLLTNATRYDILSALNDMREKLTDQDNLLIYYAGHGELDEVNLRGHWLPVDAEPGSSANWISNIAVSDILNVMSAKHVLVVADSCYSGAMTRAAVARLESGMSADAKYKWLKVMTKTRSRTVLTSGGLKPVLDRAAGSNHSVFAQAFLDTLNRNDTILEGYAVYRDVSERVQNTAARYGLEQIPEYAPIKHGGHEAGEFLFVPKDYRASADELKDLPETQQTAATREVPGGRGGGAPRAERDRLAALLM